MQVERESGKSYKDCFEIVVTFCRGVADPFKDWLVCAAKGLFFSGNKIFGGSYMKHELYFNGQDQLTLFRIIRDKTGYPLANRCLLSQAFRRSSYCAENDGKSNEVFEFVGDQILSYYMVKIVAQRCGAENIGGDYAFRILPNRLSVLKQELLSNEAFARIIDEWGVAEYLIVGRDDERNAVYKQTKIKADLFEAIIGAIAIDCKWDPVTLEKVVNKTLNLDAQIDTIIQAEWHCGFFDIDNAVTRLKELAEKEQCSHPRYNFTGPEELGYEEDGKPIWSCSCSVVNDEIGITVLVYASSKKEAKKAAAYLVLCEHFQVQNKYGINQNRWPWIYKDGKLTPKKL